MVRSAHMAATKKTNRGSPEAIAKRRAARALNRLFSEAGAAPAQLDGRTLKRKRRLMKDLVEGKNGEPLKALEVLTSATELLQLGETLASLRKLKPKLPPTPSGEEASAAILETQQLYGFDPKAWKLLGVDLARLSAPSSGDTAQESSARPRRARKKAAKKKAAKKTRRRSG